jgi:hypothetical protein
MATAAGKPNTKHNEITPIDVPMYMHTMIRDLLLKQEIHRQSRKRVCVCMCVWCIPSSTGRRRRGIRLNKPVFVIIAKATGGTTRIGSDVTTRLIAVCTSVHTLPCVSDAIQYATSFWFDSSLHQARHTSVTAIVPAFLDDPTNWPSGARTSIPSLQPTKPSDQHCGLRCQIAMRISQHTPSRSYASTIHSSNWQMPLQ